MLGETATPRKIRVLSDDCTCNNVLLFYKAPAAPLRVQQAGVVARGEVVLSALIYASWVQALIEARRFRRVSSDVGLERVDCGE